MVYNSILSDFDFISVLSLPANVLRFASAVLVEETSNEEGRSLDSDKKSYIYLAPNKS
jgi:hypothetical protein